MTTKVRHLTTLLALIAFMTPPFTFAGGRNVQVFDKIESIEHSAITRNTGSLVEIVPENQNTFLSAEWTMEQISEFYSQNSGSCGRSENQITTCVREVNSTEGRFRIIISFQESSGLIPVVEHVAIRVK